MTLLATTVGPIRLQASLEAAMNAPVKVVQLDPGRREPMPFGWPTLAMLNSSPCKRDAAQIYGRLGLHPILVHGVDDEGACTCGHPGCHSAGKHPVARGWHSAPLDLAAFDKAMVENWRLNIGLRMGRQPSGVVLVCFDVDGERSLLEPIEQKTGTPFPPTLTAKTPRGLHLIYLWPEGLEPPGNRTGIEPKVDLRGARGQIVAPPSRHGSGVQYRWLDARKPVVLT